MATISLEQYGIQVRDVARNPALSQLYCDAIRADRRCDIAASGSLIAYSGEKTGRSPTDKRIVKHRDSEADIWWGNVNIPISEDVFEINLERGTGTFVPGEVCLVRQRCESRSACRGSGDLGLSVLKRVAIRFRGCTKG